MWNDCTTWSFPSVRAAGCHRPYVWCSRAGRLHWLITSSGLDQSCDELTGNLTRPRLQLTSTSTTWSLWGMSELTDVDTASAILNSIASPIAAWCRVACWSSRLNIFTTVYRPGRYTVVNWLTVSSIVCFFAYQPITTTFPKYTVWLLCWFIVWWLSAKLRFSSRWSSQGFCSLC